MLFLSLLLCWIFVSVHISFCLFDIDMFSQWMCFRFNFLFTGVCFRFLICGPLSQFWLVRLFFRIPLILVRLIYHFLITGHYMHSTNMFLGACMLRVEHCDFFVFTVCGKMFAFVKKRNHNTQITHRRTKLKMQQFFLWSHADYPTSDTNVFIATDTRERRRRRMSSHTNEDERNIHLMTDILSADVILKAEIFGILRNSKVDLHLPRRYGHVVFSRPRKQIPTILMIKIWNIFAFRRNSVNNWLFRGIFFLLFIWNEKRYPHRLLCTYTAWVSFNIVWEQNQYILFFFSIGIARIRSELLLFGVRVCDYQPQEFRLNSFNCYILFLVVNSAIKCVTMIKWHWDGESHL